MGDNIRGDSTVTLPSTPDTTPDDDHYIDMDEMTQADVNMAEEELLLLLNGKAPADTGTIIDVFSHPADLQFVPLVKKTVSYIVVGMVFNAKGQVLLMQEAKPSCRGKWYLPAGRMEKGETIVDACRREVMEETGLDVEPVSLICMERSVDMWFRFTLLCTQKAGRLKGLVDADAESLQARWFYEHEISKKSVYFPLRAPDILPLIERARSFRETLQSSFKGVHQHPTLLPAVQQHKHLLLRMLIVSITKSGMVKVLLSKYRSMHVPVITLFTRGGIVEVALKELFKDVQGRGEYNFKICGLLAIEHNGIPAYENDGFCLTLLATCDPEQSLILSPPSIPGKYIWHVVSNAHTKELIIQRCKDLATVSLITI